MEVTAEEVKFFISSAESTIDEVFQKAKTNCLEELKKKVSKQLEGTYQSTKILEDIHREFKEEAKQQLQIQFSLAFQPILRCFDLISRFSSVLSSQTQDSQGTSKGESTAENTKTSVPTPSLQKASSTSIQSPDQASNAKLFSSEFSLTVATEHARKNYDLAKEDPLQRYMLDASQKISFEKKFVTQSKADSDFFQQTKPSRPESSSEDEDNLLVRSQQLQLLKPAEEDSGTLSQPSYSRQPSETVSSTTYKITVIQNFNGEDKSLFLQIKEFLDTLYLKNVEGPVEIVSIQRSSDWFSQRKLRVTASNFGLIFKRRSYEAENLDKFIHTLLNPVPYGKIPACEYGTKMESVARDDYIKKTGHTVQETGFWSRSDFPWLGGSPDGIVIDKNTGEKGLLEIKCPYSAKHLTIKDYIKEKKSAYLIYVGKSIVLDKGHNYYYQIQGCLFILNLEWCDFVVRTEKELFIERIKRNPEFISSMLTRLEEFYTRFLLPSLATNSYKKTPIEYVMLSKETYDRDCKKLLRRAN